MRLCVWSQAGRRHVHSKFSLHVLINGNFTLLAAFSVNIINPLPFPGNGDQPKTPLSPLSLNLDW